MNNLTMLGKFYGQIKTNAQAGAPPGGEGLWVQFSIGVYNFYKKGIEFFPCVAFGKTAERMLKLYGDKKWVGIVGALRHDKREHNGKTYNDYKIHVFSLHVPTMDGGAPAESQHQAPPPPAGGTFGFDDGQEPPF